MPTTKKKPTKKKRLTRRQPAGLENRARKLAETKIRVFDCPEFYTQKGRRQVLGDIPDLEDFENLRTRVAKLRKESEVSPEMRPCYEEPLLTRKQEFHLFRKMNYFKHRAQKLLKGMKPKLVGLKRIEKIEHLLEEADKIRNLVATCNLRLATQLLRPQNSFYRDYNLTESLLSDAYFDVLKATDYFDYNRGNKFSTYCTWVLKKNFGRDLKNQTKHMERFSTGMDDTFSDLEGKDDGFQKELVQNNRKKMVSRLLEILRDSEIGGDVSRQAFAIKKWFGVDESEHCTLEQISQSMGVTKERVRQLKEKGLELIRQKVREKGIVYDELCF